MTFHHDSLERREQDDLLIDLDALAGRIETLGYDGVAWTPPAVAKPARRRWWRIGVAAGLAAACVVIAVLVRPAPPAGPAQAAGLEVQAVVVSPPITVATVRPASSLICVPTAPRMTCATPAVTPTSVRLPVAGSFTWSTPSIRMPRQRFYRE